MYNYAIRVEQDGSIPGLTVSCRDLPELNSYGRDKEHSISETLDAIDSALSIYVDQRRVIPEASDPKAGEHIIYLPATTVAKIALWNSLMERRMRRVDLCELLGIHKAQAYRLVDFLHNSRLKQLETALAAFGKRVEVVVHAA